MNEIETSNFTERIEKEEETSERNVLHSVIPSFLFDL